MEQDVMQDPLRPLPADELIRLAAAAGMTLAPEALDHLQRRRLLRAHDDGSYSRVHLYVLALYLDAVRVYRHPWATVASERKLDDIQKVSSQIDRVLRIVAEGRADAEQAQSIHELALQIERFMNTIDPFGPVADLVDVLRPDVLAQLRGDGRLYAELRTIASALAGAAEALGAVTDTDEPQTGPVVADEASLRQTVVMEDLSTDEMDASAESSAGFPGPDEPTVVTNLSSVVPGQNGSGSVHLTSQPQEAAAEYEAAAGLVEETGAMEDPDRPAQDLPDAPDEQVSDAQTAGDSATEDEASDAEAQNAASDVAPHEEPVHTPADAESASEASADGASPHEPISEAEELEPVTETQDLRTSFSRETARSARTQALLDRLEQLKTSQHEESEAQDLEPDQGETQDLATRVQELNRLREKYINEQNWSSLVRLYEERIDLFEQPAERQQVFLTLATLYDIKLDNKGQAFDSFLRALDEDAAAGRPRAFEGLRRLGRSKSLQEAYVEWLEQRLAQDVPDAERRVLQRDLAYALHARGEGQRAFLTYAAYLAEEPASIDAGTLDHLEELASAVDDEELESFYSDVLDHEPPADVLTLVATRAGLLYVARNQTLHAIRFFRVALDADPDSELAFANLSRLYENEKNWGDLVSLIERRLAKASGDDAAALRAELERAVTREIEAGEDAIERYGEIVSEDPGNQTALERLVRAYVHHQKFAEAYAFLNRLTERVDDAAQKVEILKALAEIAIRHLHAPEEAALHFERALEVGGPRRDVLEGLARVRFEAGEWTDTIAVVTALTDGEIALPDERKIHWLSVGVEAAKQASRADALDALKARLRELDPDHEAVR